VVVGIKADAEHQCPGHFLFGRVRHQSSLKPAFNPVKRTASGIASQQHNEGIRQILGKILETAGN